GQRTPDAATVRGNRAAACDAVGASRIAAPRSGLLYGQFGRWELCARNRLQGGSCRVLRLPSAYKRALEGGGKGSGTGESRVGAFHGRSTGMKMENLRQTALSRTGWREAIPEVATHDERRAKPGTGTSEARVPVRR